MEKASSFLEKISSDLEKLFVEYSLAEWKTATNGTEENSKILSEKEKKLKEFLSDSDLFEQIKKYLENKDELCALSLRQLEMFHNYMLENQINKDDMFKIVELSNKITLSFSAFRSKVDGKEVSNNDVNDVLINSNDSEERKKYWEAFHQIADEVADNIIELVQLRNKTSRELGYNNYYEMSYNLNDLDINEVFSIFNDLRKNTDDIFKDMKTELDEKLAKKFKVSVNEIYPWHYTEPFFQDAPPDENTDLDEMYAKSDIVDLTRKTYEAMGMNISDILERSDLYERKGKDQHAFCTNINMKDDIRVLVNIKPNMQWMSTMLHEFGHGVYDKYIDTKLPLLLRQPAHIFTTEAIAMFMEKLAVDPKWLVDIANFDKDIIGEKSIYLRSYDKLQKMIVMRWIVTFVLFERELYSNPNQNLNKLWWDLRKEIQLLRLPEDRLTPDWAAKIHFGTAPVYYQNYLLGEIMASQLRGYLSKNVNTTIWTKEVGDFMRDKIFFPGSKYKWNVLLNKAFNENLNYKYFLKELVEK